MMARQHEELFPVLNEQGVGFVVFSPLANGLLTKCYTAETQFDARTDYRAAMPQFRAESFSQNEPLFALIDRLSEEHRAISSQSLRTSGPGPQSDGLPEMSRPENKIPVNVMTGICWAGIPRCV